MMFHVVFYAFLLLGTQKAVGLLLRGLLEEVLVGGVELGMFYLC